MQNIFLEKEISKLSKNNKEEMLRLFELITYLASIKEISLEDAVHYSTIIFKQLE